MWEYVALLRLRDAPTQTHARTVRLIRQGEALLNAVQRDLHRMEDERLEPGERAALERLLNRL